MRIAYPLSTNSNLVDTKPINSQLAPVLQKVDNTVHWINLYPVDNTIGFPNTYPLYSDLHDR